MEQIKHYIEKGELELAKLDANNQPIAMEYSQLEKKRNSQNKLGNIYQLVNQLTWDEKYQWINTKRLRANLIFRSGKYDEALELYLESLVAIDMKETSQYRVERMCHQLKYPIMLNMVSCFYKKKEFSKGIALCDKILSEEQGQNHQMAIYKKTNCLIQLGSYQEAKKLYKELLKLTESKSIQQSEESQKIGYNKPAINLNRDDFQQISSRLKEKTHHQQQIYKKIFQQTQKAKLEEEEENLIESNQNEEVLKYSDSVCEKINHFCQESSISLKRLAASCLATPLIYLFNPTSSNKLE